MTFSLPENWTIVTLTLDAVATVERFDRAEDTSSKHSRHSSRSSGCWASHSSHSSYDDDERWEQVPEAIRLVLRLEQMSVVKLSYDLSEVDQVKDPGKFAQEILNLEAYA